jgi:hypothetical protein
MKAIVLMGHVLPVTLMTDQKCIALIAKDLAVAQMTDLEDDLDEINVDWTVEQAVRIFDAAEKFCKDSFSAYQESVNYQTGELRLWQMMFFRTY